MDKPDFSEADTACSAPATRQAFRARVSCYCKFRRHTVFGYAQLGERLLNTIRRAIEARIFGSVSGVASQALPDTPNVRRFFPMKYLPDLPPARKALGVALVAVVAVVIVEGTGVGAASIHRHRAFIY